MVDRYYSSESYEKSIGTFAVGAVFLFVGILSLSLNSLNLDFIGIRFWGIFMFIPAFFIFIGAFSQLYRNIQFRRTVRGAILSRGGSGTVKLENLALEVGIKPKDVLRILLDLRNSGKIRYKFNPDSGEIVLGEAVSYQQASNYTPPPKNLKEPITTSDQKNFCVYCGHKIDLNANFCENCGSKM